jgi:acetyl-CoA carboxylase carboxyltransferase component
MCGQGFGQILTLAWPTAEFGTMPMSGAVRAAHRRDLETGAVDISTLEAGYEAYADILGPAESFQVDDVVDPNETRGRIARALDAARKSPVQPTYSHGIMP